VNNFSMFYPISISIKRYKFNRWKRKFGEESAFVSIRVPKSKKREYQLVIREFVDKKFERENLIINETSKLKIPKKKLDGSRKSEKILNEIKISDKREETK
ncbi:MAG: hypothetical protein ACFFDH_14045, partial [Promethearchaeota archaeon]